MLDNDPLCQTFNAFVNFFSKNVKFGYLKHHFEEVRGDVRPWLMARWKANGRDSLCIELFRYLLRLRIYEANCAAQLFLLGVDLFALNFYLDRVVRHQPFLASEN